MKRAKLLVGGAGGLVALAIITACTGPRLSRTAHANGAEIYERKCANCHGTKGQGVEGKYAGALYGDWARPKLTHYIAQNMPDDDPETLSPAEADAVATYVYDAFYSRAAQSRINPARIELTHLTNRQYAVTIAELVRSFDATEARAVASAPAERGLAATYYNAALRGRFDSSKLVHRGTDAPINFEFKEGTPAFALVGTAEFSAQWRGSIIADESGDYEFTIRTPNSVRVWINGDVNSAADALIDANVSRPDEPDHRVTVRLLGGRSYPIGIDLWALPGKTGAPPPAIALRWKPPHGSERVIPARNLLAQPAKPTFVVNTRFPADDSSRGYERGAAISKAWDEATTSAALEVANHVVKKADRWAGTSRGDLQRAEKLERLAERFMIAAWRRPLSSEQKARYVAELFKTAADPDTALKRVTLLALMSPQFLYPELPAMEPADDFAVATRLSYALWDGPPDRALTEAAATGRLRTPAEISAQATRMLGDPLTRAKLREFFHHWLNVRFVEDLKKDPALYADFTSEVVDDLRTSLDVFLDGVVWKGSGDFREILRADYLVVNPRLAKFYGLPPPASDEFVRVPVPAVERSGVLTHPYLLATLSYKSTSSPIHRGVFLTRNIVGRSLKPPPMAQTFNDTQFTADMTMREKVVQLTRSESCQGCHAVINPLGFSLEWYDAVGRFRREENGRAIDAMSDYLTDDNQRVRLTGARDVAEFAIASEQANFAFIEQLFHYLVKQPVAAFGPNTPVALREAFVACGYNLPKLMAEIATVSATRPQITDAR